MSTDIMTRTIAPFEESSLKSFSSAQEQSNDADNSISSQNLMIIRKFDKGKLPVYQVKSKITKQQYAMKVFPDDIEDSSENFENELRFASLNHPNVIKIVGSDRDQTISQRGLSMKATYVLSEFAFYGDFLDLIINHKSEFDDKFARTYFRQLIDGLEYLHSKGIAHLDIKPENLLIGDDFTLKIADFDLSHVTGDTKTIGRGTPRYRGPEFYNSKATNIQLDFPFASDIYSAAIILFILKSGGIYPHSEHQLTDGINFTELMEKESSKFWKKHAEMQGKPKDFFDSNFKKLFFKMVKTNPKKRITIAKIKQSKWYNGPVYTPQELQQKMKGMLCW